MNADDLRARLTADLEVAYLVAQSERPEGLTASSLGGCMSYAARTLLREPKGRSNDFWRAARGTYIHDGLGNDLNLMDDEFLDGRRSARFTWDPGNGLPVITGQWDGVLCRVMLDFKSRSRTQCRWHADHGPDPDQCMQVASAAEAEGYELAAVVYVPTDAGWEEAVVCMVDVAHWAKEARAWLWQVDVRAEYQALVDRGVPPDEARRQVLDSVPRDKPYSWCSLLCDRFVACRGGYQAPTDLEIMDPVMRQAAQEEAHWAGVESDAKARRKAAKDRLTHVEGTVHDQPGSELRVTQEDVKATPGRRGHKRTKVERRPG